METSEISGGKKGQPDCPDETISAVQASAEMVGEGISDPLVTVCISTFRSERFMRACLENLTHQTIFNRCEIIIVDSGSPENERGIVAEFQSQHSNIRYVRTAHEKVAEAWNRGLSLAQGSYFASLSADDSMRHDALAVLVAALERHADCNFAYGDVVWTSQPNDTFPCANFLRTVKYPDYAPVETLFYCLTGCVQFFRTCALRQVGGFDATLYCAADYEVILKMVAAGMNAVHIPEPLTLFYQNTGGITQSTNRSALEHEAVMERCRKSINIANIFQVEPGNKPAAADALAGLGVRAAKFFVPWEDRPAEHVDFAFACFHAALELDPENQAAGTNLVVLSHKLKRLNPDTPELIRRWPKLREWITLFHLGEGAHLPPLNHALLGPVYRPAENVSRPRAEQLAREPKALHPWICRVEGRQVYLSEDIFPRAAGLRYQPAELEAAGKRLMALLLSLPPFYAHLGGAGDLLLLLASFYDQTPDGVVFSYPNSVGATKALLDGFPKLSKIYFLPQHAEPFFHVVLRYAVCTLRNCLGAGATPRDNYDEEWKAGMDIEKKYHIKKSPRWAAALRQNLDSRQIAVAPKGSLAGMVGSKRNLIALEIWPQVLAHIQERGFEPVIFGLPSEAKEYPALPGCTDVRGESFAGQMRRIGRCAGLVGADSWAKTFSALAEIPTLVFEPQKGTDLAAWKDPSDWVFIEPWPAIKMVRSPDKFRHAFDAHIAKISGATFPDCSKAVIAWEGSFLDYGSLSHINRELTSRFPANLNLMCVGPGTLAGSAKSDPAMRHCAKKLIGKAPADAAVTVRHQWPPNWSRLATGTLVVIQPWEYGALPKAWMASAGNVDEFWVPSPLVRTMYLDSGIAPEKVRVVPNGVDTKKFKPGTRPLDLPTRKKFKFLFVGGTIFRKGPDILLDAFLQAFKAADDVCLVIKDFGGDTCYQGQTAEAAIRAIQQKPDAPEIIHLTRELSAGQMPSLYAACDCLVHPYRGEGFGMPVLEAMACGLPVIVTGGGATDSFVSANAGWIIPGRPLPLGNHVGGIPLVKPGWMIEPSKTHLVAILKQAASQPAECRKRGTNGRATAEKRFDWNDIAAGVAHRLRELVERTPVPPSKPMARRVAAKAVAPPAVTQVGQIDEARELFRVKKFQAAWEATMAAIGKRPFHPEAFLLLAEIALAAGDGRTASLCAEYARQIAPGLKNAKPFLNRSLKEDAQPDWLQLPENVQSPKTKAQSLSVCLIVKNEEAFLAQCLRSIRSMAQQIIVVDTGSTDRTIEIAREFGAEIYSFAWVDDFAAARNAALERATGDWILMLDADEELPAGQHAKLLADINKSGVLACRLPLINRERETEGQSFVPRLFRNAPEIYYSGRIHEQVFPSLLANGKSWGLKTTLGTAEILHHGYTREMVRDRNKIERNLKLLRQAVEENPMDANLMMNFGLELVRSNDLAGGVAKYREAFQLMSVQPAEEVAPELREVLLTQFTCQLYKLCAHEEVVQVLNSPLAKGGELTASLHFALGLSQFEMKNFSAAAGQMHQCLGKRKQPALSPINTDILTAAPDHCLALSLVKTGDFAGAEEAFQSALTGPGGREEVKLDYARFLAGQNRQVEALQKLHELVAANSGHLGAWRTGGEIALSRPEFLEFARDWTGEAMRYVTENFVIVAQRAEALMLSGDTARAVELWERAWIGAPQPAALAALILCQTMESPTTHAPQDEHEEAIVSREFIAWYRKLLAVKAQKTIVRLNEQIDKLSRALPGAAKILEATLGEVERCA